MQERKAVEAELKKIRQKLEKMEERYAFRELSRATYEKFQQRIATEELQPLQAHHAQLASDLSNLQTYTDFAVEMTANLSILWEKADLLTRQQLQEMIHLDGIAFAPKSGLYRTGRTNAIFDTIASLSASKTNKKPVLARQNVLRPVWWAQLESNQ